jgi:hypothetical protein
MPKTILQFNEGLDHLTLCGLNIVVMNQFLSYLKMLLKYHADKPVLAQALDSSRQKCIIPLRFRSFYLGNLINRRLGKFYFFPDTVLGMLCLLLF